MTGRSFRTQVIWTIIIVAAFSLASYSASYLYGYEELFRAMPGLAVPLGAAWIAYCYQRRVAFTKALFDVWQKIVVSVQEAIQYTRHSSPQQQDFAKVMQSLSCRIDDVRGAFRNVGEDVTLTNGNKQFVSAVKNASNLAACSTALQGYLQPKIGTYPFESLKQIQSVIRLLGFGANFTPANAQVARATIVALWQILRGELLKELDRDFPQYPDTPFTANG